MTPERRLGKTYSIVAVATGLLVVATLFVGLLCDTSPEVDKLIVGLWVVGPPAWLFVEWFYILKPAIAAEATTVEVVGHQQSVVRAMWGAFVVVIAVLYDVYPLATA